MIKKHEDFIAESPESNINRQPLPEPPAKIDRWSFYYYLSLDLLLINIQINMQDSNSSDQCLNEAHLFDFCPEAGQNCTALADLKSQASCRFYRLEYKGIERRENRENREKLRLEIRGDWVCEVSKREGNVLSAFRCNRHYSFEVLRRIDEGESGDLMAVGLQLWLWPTQEGPLSLHIEENQREQLQYFAGVLQSKHLTQRGFDKTFKPIRRLGKGFTSIVYSALNVVDRKIYAVKCYKKSGDESRSQAIKEVYEVLCQIAFQKQFSIWRELSHPGLAKLITAYESEQSIYMVTDQLYITLQTFISHYGFLKKNKAKKLLKDLLQGLNYLHSRGVMHRDIKLENIMIKKQDLSEGVVTGVIVDFGLAEYLHEEKYLFQRCGTPGYTAPQILARGSREFFEKYDQKCDIFSFGVVAYTLLLKKFPFHSSTVPEIIQKNTECVFEFNRSMQEAIGEDGLDFLSRLLAKDPRGRMSCEQALRHPFLLESSSQPEKKIGSTTLDLVQK